MKVPVKGETECKTCNGKGYICQWSVGGGCATCKGKGKIPTLTYKEVSAEDQVTEQINQWYNGR